MLVSHHPVPPLWTEPATCYQTWSPHTHRAPGIGGRGGVRGSGGRWSGEHLELSLEGPTEMHKSAVQEGNVGFRKSGEPSSHSGEFDT